MLSYFELVGRLEFNNNNGTSFCILNSEDARVQCLSDREALEPNPTRFGFIVVEGTV